MISKTHTRTKAKTLKTEAPASALPDLVNQILQDGKAQDILTLDLKGKTSLTDTLIIASGTSTRHVMALANTLTEKLKEAGYHVAVDGKQSAGKWVVLDLGDAIVHIFHPEARAFYEIEELWGAKTPSLKTQPA